jgi:uncharacterized protein YggU (UPF0235/DUF167 family)
VTSLDYLLAAELLLLVTAAIFWVIGEVLGRGNPRDELRHMMRTFWHQVLLPKPGTAVAFLVEQPVEVHEEAPVNPEDATAMLMVSVAGAKPNNAITGFAGDELDVQTTLAADAGEANKIIIDLLAKAIGLQPYRIKLVKGHYASRKQLQVNGMDLDRIAGKLAKFS